MESEKEKMISGKLYQAGDEELSRERLYAKEKIFKFNRYAPSEIIERHQELKELFGKTTGPFHIEAPFYCDYGYNIEIGKNFFSNYNLTVLDCAKVTIGDNVMIGPNTGIYTAGHPLNHQLRSQEYEYALPIRIGNHVWIGGNVVINPGVSIGDRSVIGSGSVVTKDIPANVVAAGNPCRVLREITNEDKV